MVSGLSIPLGFLISLALKEHWLHRVAHRLKVSKKFPNVDVWSFVMDVIEKHKDDWVVIRDLDHDLIYEGRVKAFSDSTDDFDELFLIDAVIYRNSTGTRLYEVPALYVSARHGNKAVEFPNLDISSLENH